MICSDIDGTLLDKNRSIASETAFAVQQIRDRIPFLLASSRMPSSMEGLQDDLGTGRLPMVCYNGGLVLSYRDGQAQTLMSEEIEAAVTTAIAAECQKVELHVSLYRGDEWYVPAMDQWAKREENNTRVSPLVKAPLQVAKEWQVSEAGAHKIMLMGEENKINQLEEFLLTQFGNHLHIYRSRPTYIEIASKRISKASGIQKILEHSGSLTMREVMSFGDNYNDIDMLEASGTGIAVANAKPEVIHAADEVTLSNKEHGVAASIHKYFSS